MKRELTRWPISQLRARLNTITFPDYQREPTVWDLDKMQRLIDSILRGFDIASIYFYRSGEAEYDCIDGRQRINAIISFLGINRNPEAGYNNFKFHATNEIYQDDEPFRAIEGKRYGDDDFGLWRPLIESYQLNVVELGDVKEPLELNHLFLRLQLGSILNSGEKLHAMTGAMRQYIFEALGSHAFFSSIAIPYRRFSREQVAAQIACNIFSLHEVGTYARTRYIDLQVFFKRHMTLEGPDWDLCQQILGTAQAITDTHPGEIPFLRNRALTVSFFLYCHHLVATGETSKLTTFKDFFELLLRRVSWQIHKGLEMDREYEDLLRFQTDVTQASVEKSAVTRRHEFILNYFSNYLRNSEIIGDSQYRRNKGAAPGEEP